MQRCIYLGWVEHAGRVDDDHVGAVSVLHAYVDFLRVKATGGISF